jgi:uncharacterized protein YbaP (TraB family)
MGFAAALALAQPAPAAAQAPAAPRPAIWLLEDADTKIYLFGTIHILPPGFKWRSAALDRVVDGADELVVESYDKAGGDAGEDMWDEAANLFLAEQPSPILERVPAEKRDALRAAIAAGPVPIEGYDMMQTWAAAITLGLSTLLGEYGVADVKDAPGVEDVLEEAFRKAGKPIGSVENPVAVLGAMNALPAAVQSQLLVETIDTLAKGKQASDEMDAAWAAGEAERMIVGETDDLPPAIYDVLIRKRNAAWTLWLADRLERPGKVLFAVGAGHLAGPDSVQKMLAARGLQARRID